MCQSHAVWMMDFGGAVTQALGYYARTSSHDFQLALCDQKKETVAVIHEKLPYTQEIDCATVK